MRKNLLAHIRLLAALIILIAVVRSTGTAHESRVDTPVDVCVPIKLANIVCLDGVDETRSGSWQCGTPGSCKTCTMYAGEFCEFGEHELEGFIWNPPEVD